MSSSNYTHPSLIFYRTFIFTDDNDESEMLNNEETTLEEQTQNNEDSFISQILRENNERDNILQEINQENNITNDFINNFSYLTIRNFVDDIYNDQLSIALQESLELYNSVEKKEDIIVDVSCILYKDIGDDEFLKNQNICSICLHEYENEDKISITQCKHVFHNSCIKEWGHYKQECPLCKNNLPIKK